jgi:outer membrane immunogenic protein
MQKLFIAAAALFALSSQAMAADLPATKDAPVYVAPAAVSWTGAYVGVTAGVAFGSSSSNTSTIFDRAGYFAQSSVPAIAAVGAQSANTTGFTGGATIGFNKQINNFVLGVEGDFQYFGQNAETSRSGIYPCCAPTGFNIASKASADWLVTLRPRVGMLIAPNWLVYATGGLAISNINYKSAFTDTFATASAYNSFPSTAYGFAVGGGAEYALTANWSIKGEYLYVNFAKTSDTSATLQAFTPAVAFPTNTFTHSADLTSNIVRLGLNYKFSAPEPVVVAKY